jgi:hypothetical protein
MSANDARFDPSLIADLNDLLKLDHDANHAYGLAILALRDRNAKQALRGYREDHRRHIRELNQAILAHGGVPIRLPHVPTGFFKLAMQAAGIGCGDPGILLAFKANEGQVRSKYARHAMRPYPPDIGRLVRQNAADEEEHYAWVVEMLDGMGAGAGTASGTVAWMVEMFHGRAADLIETVEWQGLRLRAQSLRR